MTTKSATFVEGDWRLKVYRYIRTGTQIASWICLGMYNEVVGPTLPDLKDRIGCNYEEISRVLSARSAGLFLGSLFGGVLHDKYSGHRELIMALALLLSGLTIAVAPWCTSLAMLGVVFHLMGHSHALLTTGGNPSIAVLWADRAEGPYQLLHSGFGLGAILGPIISRPYLSKDHFQTNTTYYNISLNESFVNETALKPEGSRIEYPYAFVGICCAAVAIVFLIFYVKSTPKPFRVKSSNWRELFNPQRCSGGQTLFGIEMLALIFVFYLFIVGGERAFGKFVFSYAIESNLKFSKNEAAMLNVLFWICFTGGRVTAFILSKWVPVYILLFGQIAGTLVSAIFLNIFPDHRLSIWILTGAFGFFKSPLFPSGLGWVNHYITISSMTITIVNIGSSTGGMLVQWLTGYMFEYYGPVTFMYILLAYTVAILLTFLAMFLLARTRNSRFSNEDSKEITDRPANGHHSQIYPDLPCARTRL